MFKKLHNLFSEEPDDPIVSETPNNPNYHSEFNLSAELTDSLGQKESAEKAVNSYRDEIRKNSPTEDIELKMAQLLRQQQNISESYQKLAAAFKEQGNIDQAAEYYRQAIITKSLISSNSNNNKAQKSASSNINSSSMVHKLSDSAFSFLPLLTSASKSTNTKEKNLQNKTLFDQSSPTSALGYQDKNIKIPQDTNITWETIQLYAEQALDGYDNCQWQVTIDACKKILQLAPEMAEAHKILGNALQRMGDTAKAMDCYAKALKIQPDLAIVYGGIGKLYYQQQKWLKAKEYYQKATIINPRYPEAYLNLAYVWQQLEQPEKAEFCQKRAANIQQELPSDSLSPVSENKALPSSTQAGDAILTYYKLAQNLEQNHKWQEAALHYRKAVELNNIYLKSGNDVQPKGTLTKFSSQTSTRQSQLERAIKHYAHQAKLKPSSAQIQFNLANLYAKNQQLEEAITSYKQAIKIEPSNGQAYINLGKALAKMGQKAESVEQLYLGYTIQPELADADNLFNLGKSLVQQGDRKRAVNCYSFAINLKPDFVGAYHRLAETLIDLGRKREAIECYRKSIQHNPQDTHSHFVLGEQYVANRQWDNAVEAYRRVLELEPQYPQAAYKLSHALSEKLKSELADR